MSGIDIDLLRREECQPLTSEQIADIKSQFHPQAGGSNVNIVPYHIYDTDEHVVGEWRETIDGVKKKKPLYEKTIVTSGINISSGTIISHGISGIDKVLFVNASIFMNNLSVPITYITQSNTVGTGINSVSSTTINIRGTDTWTPNDYNEFSITLQYTKTTDQWQTV